VVVLASLAVAFALTSPAFHAGGAIPARYTCDGSGVSPPLRWTAPPRGTRSFTLTMRDLDAGFLHWRATGIAPSRRSLAAGAHAGHELANDFGRRGYGGPCPPSGTHRYRFELDAIGAHGRVLARATLLGRYGR
jgi:Raf kinase inhibitor-like YbhB/YbcL family protein